MALMPPLEMTKGNLSRRVLQVHSPPVVVVLRPPVPRAVLRQTCRPGPKVQRPALIRSSASRATIRRDVGMAAMTACGTVMIGRNCFFNRSEIMASRKLIFLIVAFVTSTSLPVFAQGAGASGAGSGAAAGASSGAVTGAGTGPAATTGTVGTTTDGPHTNNQAPTTAAPAGSPTAAQADRNAGVGTAPNGVPIGSPGSGVGSPEHPVGSNR